VTQRSNRRAIEKLEVASGRSRPPPWIEALRAMEREYKAARIFTAFARALAGTDKMQMQVRDETPPPAVPSAPPPRSAPTRPGPHDVLTWEEAMRIPWLDTNAADD
jgi:hypothetical protein